MMRPDTEEKRKQRVLQHNVLAYLHQRGPDELGCTLYPLRPLVRYVRSACIAGVAGLWTHQSHQSQERDGCRHHTIRPKSTQIVSSSRHLLSILEVFDCLLLVRLGGWLLYLRDVINHRSSVQSRIAGSIFS